MTNHGTPVRIFLVEDSAPDVVLIREALHAQNLDHRIKCCVDGEEAIRVLAQAEASPIPDLIILDLNLPRIGGFDVLRWIRSTPRLSHVPVAILTSSQAAKDSELAERLGASAFISKPPNLADFLSVVGRALVELLPRGRRNTTLSARYRGQRNWWRNASAQRVSAFRHPRRPHFRHSAFAPGRPLSTTKLARVFTPAPGLVTNGTMR